MSNNLQALDEFPTFTGEESPQEQIRQLQNYLFIVKEQLQYAMRNIGIDNLNAAQWSAMKVETLDGQTPEEALKKLTDNGKKKGLFDINGQLCFNGDYIVAGLIKAGLIDVENLVVQLLKSVEGNSTLDISGASIRFRWGNNTTICIENGYDNLPIIYVTDYDDNGKRVNETEISGHHLKVGGTSAEPAVSLSKDNHWGGKVAMDTLLPSGDGNCKWEYIEAIGKTVLVKHR